MIWTFVVTGGAVAAAALALAAALIFEPAPRGLVAALGRMIPASVRNRYADSLRILGLSGSPEILAGLKYGGLVAGVGLAAVALAGGVPAVGAMAFALGTFAWAYPDHWLRAKEKVRLEDLRSEFPLMVTLVRVYARASDLYQALNITRGALRGELRKQLDTLVSELQVLPLKQALMNFAARCNYPPVSNFVSVVLFGITTGADVDCILDSFSRRSYEARVNEIKRRIKVQPLVMSILPAVMAFSLLLLFVFPMYSNIIDRLRAF